MLSKVKNICNNRNAEIKRESDSCEENGLYWGGEGESSVQMGITPLESNFQSNHYESGAIYEVFKMKRMSTLVN